jgi:plastocyanin
MSLRFARWTAVWAACLAVCWVAATAAAPKKSAMAIHTVTISGFAFQPETLTVNAGDTVIWKNKDMVRHTVTAADGSFRSGNIAPGGTWKLVAKKVGTFDYICTPHPNMHGKLIVK